MIPWQAKDSSENGILQEERLPPGWDRTWGTQGNWFRLNWLEGTNLEEFLQQWIAAVAHLDGTLVRPRWQAEPPNIPDFETACWAATGLLRQRPINTYSFVEHFCDNPDGDGHDVMTRWEELEVLATFYGPQADEYAGRLHSNLMVWQNTHVLRSVGMAFVEISEAVRIPELIKEKWLERIDKRLILRRSVVRRYPVLNFLGFEGRIETDGRSLYRSPFGYPKREPPEPPPPEEYEDDAPEDDILYGRQDRSWRPALPIEGGRMQGRLGLDRDPTQPRQAVPRRRSEDRDGGTY